MPAGLAERHGALWYVQSSLLCREAVGGGLTQRSFQVETYLSAEAFLARPLQDEPGCIVSDLHMPGKNGLELQTALSQRGQAPPMLFLTGAGDIPSTVSAIKGGAVDFLEKRAPQDTLLEAVRRALAQDQHARFAALSARELEVLGQVVRGKMNKEIAAALGLHERTVKLHRTAITRKLRVPSVAELTRLWVEAGNTV